MMLRAKVAVSGVLSRPAKARGSRRCCSSLSLLSMIETRHCTHSFDRNKAVTREQIHAVLKAARNAPSTNNTQPWTVIVTQGAMRDELAEKMLEKFDAGDDGKV